MTNTADSHTRSAPSASATKLGSPGVSSRLILRSCQRNELSDLRENAAAGTPLEVAERLRAYRDVGASRCYLQVIDIDDLDQVALIAAEVMPLLEDR